MSALVELISPAALMQGVIMNTHITVHCARGVCVLAALSSALALALPPLLHVLYFHTCRCIHCKCTLTYNIGGI